MFPTHLPEDRSDDKALVPIAGEPLGLATLILQRYTVCLLDARQALGGKAGAVLPAWSSWNKAKL